MLTHDGFDFTLFCKLIGREIDIEISVHSIRNMVEHLPLHFKVLYIEQNPNK